MISEVFRCSQLFSDVFRLVSDDVFRLLKSSSICTGVLRYSQMFSDDHRCFWIFSRYSVDVLLMFSRWSLDVPRMIAGFFQDDHFK